MHALSSDPSIMSAPSMRPMAGPIPHSLAVAQAALGQDSWLQPATQSALSADQPRLDCTLLEVIDAIADVADNDDEVLATLAYMLDSGRVRLSGLLDPEATEARVSL
jgi:hypothetical protein